MSPEFVLKVTKRVIEAKQELASAQAEWDRIFNGNGMVDAPTRSRLVDGDSNKARIVELMEQEPGREFEATDISERFGIPIGTARTTLSKMVKAGRIEKRGFGSYGANAPRSREQEKEVASEEGPP